MFYTILIILFILVFVFLFYRIQAGSRNKGAGRPVDTYVCPQCNENDCECQKVDKPE